MNDTTTTFLDFIQNHTIQIPLIQRDYVQGLALNESAEEKRNEFVKKLLDALCESKPYTLDFIYGARESFDDTQDTSSPFLPLDGQQRLTTLYLLHWILAIKTNKNDTSKNILNCLRKFSYKTRISSDKFCRRLLDSDFDIDKSLHEQIINKTWYGILNNDPTVIAIMEMIKQIENNLSENKYKSCIKKMADNLFNPESHCITFSILDMERYHLTDGLYVKMNARGKELTLFENWKADFINLICRKKELKDKFTYSIEHEWNDVFWKDVYMKYASDIEKVENERDKRKIKYPRIDEHFMNFFINFSRLYYFMNIKTVDAKADEYNGKLWHTTESIYGNNSDYLQELFNSLDSLVHIEQKIGIDNFFNELFYTGKSSDWDTINYGTKLFECSDVNLFRSCFEDENFKWQHILLYAVLKYCSKHNVSNVTNELKVYARICRNYLYQHNYLDNGKVNIVGQIRVTDIKTYDKVFDFLCSKIDPLESLQEKFTGIDASYIDNEREKIKYYKSRNDEVIRLLYKTEDTSLCRGFTKAFSEVLNKCLDRELPCDKTWKAIYSFIQASGMEKARLFIAYNYLGMIIGNDCAYGKRIFLGGTNRWDVHFRKNDSAISKWLTEFVRAYISTSDIKSMISEVQRNAESKTINKRDMRDYMLKYDHFIGAQLQSDNIDDAPFYYAMPNPWKDMDAIVIHSFSSRPLGNSYQTCPMVCAVVHSMSNYDNKHMGFAGHGSSKARIYIHNGDWSNIYFDLYFSKKDWRITPDSYSLLNPDLQSKLTPIYENGKIVSYQLILMPEKDLIENAKDFTESAVIYFKSKGLI